MQWEESCGILDAQIKRKQAEERCDRESNEQRKGEMFREEESAEREVISGDLLLQRCIEVCTADRSVMDFRVR